MPAIDAASEDTTQETHRAVCTHKSQLTPREGPGHHDTLGPRHTQHQVTIPQEPHQPRPASLNHKQVTVTVRPFGQKSRTSPHLHLSVSGP